MEREIEREQGEGEEENMRGRKLSVVSSNQENNPTMMPTIMTSSQPTYLPSSHLQMPILSHWVLGPQYINSRGHNSAHSGCPLKIWKYLRPHIDTFGSTNACVLSHFSSIRLSAPALPGSRWVPSNIGDPREHNSAESDTTEAT